MPTFVAMPRMLKELDDDPASGFLGAEGGLGTIIQYWRSFEDLERYANSRDHEHWPAWRETAAQRMAGVAAPPAQSGRTSTTAVTGSGP